MNKSIIINAFCQKFYEFSKGKKAPDTLENYRWNLDTFLTKFKGKPLDEITKEDLDTFISTLTVTKQKKIVPANPRTKNVMLSTLRCLFSLATEWGYLDKNPILGVKRCKPTTDGMRILTESELKSLISEANPVQLVYLEVAILTGLRVGALRRLMFKDIDWNSNTITVHNKGGGSYTIPMHPKLIEILTHLTQYWINPQFSLEKSECLPRSDEQKVYVFCNRDGSPYSRGFRCLKKLYDKLNIKGVGLHGLRKTYCTLLAKNHLQPKEIQQLMGHKSPTMALEYYIKYGDGRISDAVNSLPSFV